MKEMSCAGRNNRGNTARKEHNYLAIKKNAERFLWYFLYWGKKKLPGQAAAKNSDEPVGPGRSFNLRPEMGSNLDILCLSWKCAAALDWFSHVQSAQKCTFLVVSSDTYESIDAKVSIGGYRSINSKESILPSLIILNFFQTVESELFVSK